MSAEVTIGGKKHANQNVSWSVSGKQAADTSISESGLLTIGADEYIGGTLTVQALSAADGTTIGTYTVTLVSPWDVSGVGNITPGSMETAAIDGMDWYVLARDGNKALLLSKDILEERAFDADDNVWQGSDMQTYLNGEWLTGKAVLNAHAVETALNTRKEFNSEEWDESRDKVFLLSEADVFGTFSNNEAAQDKDYTLGTAGIIVPENMRIAQYDEAGHSYDFWLRSPSTNENCTAGNSQYGRRNYYRYDSIRGVRPAMWIDLAQ